MATATINTGSRPAPFTVSVKKKGDGYERFQSLQGSFLTFEHVQSGAAVYVITITDAAGGVSTSEENLTCQGLPVCQEGPKLLEIKQFDAFGAKFEFHGVRVDQLRWKVINLSNTIMDMGLTYPGSSEVIISFINKLNPAHYLLEISGASCYSPEPSSKPFTIPEEEQVLAWATGSPTYDSVNGMYRILWAIKQSGTFFTRLTDSLGAVKYSQTNQYTPGAIFNVAGLTDGTYLLELGGLQSTIVISQPQNNCQDGPDLIEPWPVMGKTQGTFTFHGLNVPILRWSIIDTSNNTIVRTNTVTAGSPTVTINYETLSAGSYLLRITGASCSSDNSDRAFTITDVSLSMGAVIVQQQTNGQYKLIVNFNGGTANYLIRVKTLSGSDIATFANTTGSPANITLPAGTPGQTVKVSVTDANNLIAENAAVVLPSAAPVMNMLQAVDYSGTVDSTPMATDGIVYPIKTSTTYNWNPEFVLPNGGLYDHVIRKLEKKTNSTYVEVNLQTLLGEPGSVSVPSTTSSIKLLTPRNAQNIFIDGLNPFKTAATWRATFTVLKGGASGSIIATIQREFKTENPVTLSGIILYGRNGATLGSAIGEIQASGSVYQKPTPQFDIATTGFGGVSFDNIIMYYRQKVNNVYVQRYTFAKDWQTPQTTLNPEETSLFKSANFAQVHVSILAQQPGEWQIEIIARTGSTVKASKMAEFAFTADVG